MRRILRWLRAVPHLFGKGAVSWCLFWGTVCSVYALRILSRTGHDPAALLGVILAFLGGELALMFGRDALSGNKKTRGETPGGKEDTYDRTDSEYREG